MCNFDLVKLLGKGSYGKVFLAKLKPSSMDESPEYYAIKTARIKHSSTLRKEKHILKLFIECPEIVQCLGSEITQKPNSSKLIYNLKLEYAAGGTLADLIRRKKKIPEDEAKEYLRMILKGLSKIHSKGFVHADIKPHNILAFPQSDGKIKLKIADFGLSMKRGDKNKDHFDLFNFKGTPPYMSPESIIFPEYNPALDIWSLGCTLVKMVSGKSVWRNCSSNDELITKLVLDMKVPKIPRGLSKEGQDFIGRCFEHDPNQRWTADMLLQHSYLNDGETEASMLIRITYLPRELIELYNNKANYDRKKQLLKELYKCQMEHSANKRA